jgi:hypothetical protein
MSSSPGGEDFGTARAAGETSERTDEGRKKTNVFLRRLFANGPYLEESFGDLCADGCSAEVLGDLIHAMSMLSAFRSHPRLFVPGRELLVNSGAVSKAQLRALPKKLRSIADTIQALNATVLSPANDIKLAPFDAKRQNMREFMIRQYGVLPQVLRIYSLQLERFPKVARRIAKRLTSDHVHAIFLIRYVENSTGSPHYEDVANLLEQGCLATGYSKKAPSFLSVEGLTKMYQRWGNVVCGPR